MPSLAPSPRFTPEEQAFLDQYRVKEEKAPRFTPEEQAFLDQYRVNPEPPPPAEKGLLEHGSDIVSGIGKGAARAATHAASWFGKAGEYINPTGNEYTEEELAQLPEWQREGRAGLRKPKERAQIQRDIENVVAPQYFATHSEGLGAPIEDLMAQELPSALEMYASALGNPLLAAQFYVARSTGTLVSAGAKEVGFSEKNAAIAGGVTELLLALYNPKKVTSVAQNLYEKTKSILPGLKPVDAEIVASVANKAEEALKSSTISLDAKAALKPLLEEYRSVFSDNVAGSKLFRPVPAEQLLAQNSFVNKGIGKVIADYGLSSNDRSAAKKLLSAFAGDINNAAYTAKGPGAANFVKYQKAGDHAFQTVAQNRSIPKGLMNAVKRTYKGNKASSNAVIYTLYQLGLLGPVARASGAATPALAANAVLQRMWKDPNLRRYYLKALGERAIFDFDSVVKTISDMNEAAEEEP